MNAEPGDVFGSNNNPKTSGSVEKSSCSRSRPSITNSSVPKTSSNGINAILQDYAPDASSHRTQVKYPLDLEYLESLSARAKKGQNSNRSIQLSDIFQRHINRPNTPPVLTKSFFESLTDQMKKITAAVTLESDSEDELETTENSRQRRKKNSENAFEHSSRIRSRSLGPRKTTSSGLGLDIGNKKSLNINLRVDLVWIETKHAFFIYITRRVTVACMNV